MSYSDRTGNYFGRLLEDGNVAVLHVEDGYPATRMDCSIYPVNGGGAKSVRYEHPEGIVISREDAARIGLDIEE